MKKSVVAAIAFAILTIAIGCGGRAPEPSTPADSAATPGTPVHAEVTVFIMARCPHCASLLQILLPLRRELGDAVVLTTGFVGSVDAQGKADLSHGDDEVKSAQIQICAGLAAGNGPWLAFMECLYKDDTWQSLPDGYEDCAKQSGIDADAVRACVKDGTGEAQLKESIEVATTEGIEGVPMVFINGSPWVGRRDRESLLSGICFGGNGDATLPAACAGMERPETIDAVLLSDTRCESTDACRIDRELAFLHALLPSMQMTSVDYATEEGQTLYSKAASGSGLHTLPLLIIRNSLVKFEDANRLLGDMLIPFEDGFLLPLGSGFDPTLEICDNNLDDNGDGAVDCGDEDCVKLAGCRPEIKGRVDLFVMSQCPFGAMMIPPVDHFLNHMKRDRTAVDLDIQFIGDQTNGEFSSMHGPAEVAEDIRTLCVQELYGENYAFMEYALCRARDYRSDDWKTCVGKKMNVKAIAACADGEQGRALLSASFALAEELGVQGSPSMLFNNRDDVDARTAGQIFEAFCARNSAEMCKTPIKPLLIDSEGDAPPASCE